MSGRGDDAVEVRLAALDGFHQIFGADHFGAGLLGFLGLVAAREHRDADVLAGALGQIDHAADHLVGVARIDAQVHRQLDGLVELGGGEALDEADRFVDGVELLAVDLVGLRSSASWSAWPSP